MATALAVVGPALAEETPRGGPPESGSAFAAVVAPSPIKALASTDSSRPPPLHVEYAQYGAAINSLLNISSGETCGATVRLPCILGSGGGLVLRGGYRPPGPWYIGGAYAFAKLDSHTLYRLGIFQQLWAEMRYIPDTGFRGAPYITWGVGGAAYGNEWGIETGGAMLSAGGGVEFEVTRLAVFGLSVVYKPTLFASWTDTASIARPLGVAHFLGMELQLEIRTELGRR